MTEPKRPALTDRRRSVPAASAAGRRWRERLSALNLHAGVVLVTVVVVIVALGLIAYGYWDTYLRPAREPAVRVGSRTYDMTYFVRRMRLALTEPSGLSPSPAQIAALPEQLAQDIINEETALQRAPSLGVAVSDDDIDKELAARVRAIVTTDEQGHVQRSPSFEVTVREVLKDSGLTLAQYRRAVHGQLLLREIQKHFERQIPDAAPGVQLRVITVKDEAKARDLKRQLDGGADFAQLASAQSEDASKSNGGLRDWAPKGSLPPAVEEVAYRLPVGAVSDPFAVDGQWYIIKVEDRSENREITAQQKSDMAKKQRDEWLAEQAKQLQARSYLGDSRRQRYALEQSGALDLVRRFSQPGQQPVPISIPPQVTPQAPQPGGTP